MKLIETNESLFEEKYRPQRVSDLILPDALKSRIQKCVDAKDIPNFGLFSSIPGTGKTSTAKAIIREIGGEALWIPASKERSIDVLRGKVEKFASSNSFDDNIKIVVMDEFDNFSQDGQKALRGFIEEYSSNCRFIFTGNDKNKIHEAVLSRMEVYDYNNLKKEEMIKPIFDRLRFILENENIEYKTEDLKPIISTFYPRIRSMVIAIQQYSSEGVLQFNQGDLDDATAYDKIMHSVVNSGFSDYNNIIISVNKLNAPENMYIYLYKNAGKFFDTKHYPNVVICIAKYQHMSASVPDRNLNLAACLTELMQIKKIRGTYKWK